jgi:hypothetical protein
MKAGTEDASPHLQREQQDQRAEQRDWQRLLEVRRAAHKQGEQELAAKVACRGPERSPPRLAQRVHQVRGRCTGVADAAVGATLVAKDRVERQRQADGMEGKGHAGQRRGERVAGHVGCQAQEALPRQRGFVPVEKDNCALRHGQVQLRGGSGSSGGAYAGK